MPKTENGVHRETMLTGVASAKAAKLAEINSKCDATLRSLTATYPDMEMLTFDQQKREAEAYQANQTTACPLLEPLALARGISMADLAGRVLSKASAFSSASGALIGQRQAMEDTLDSCTTIADVQAINVTFSLAGATV